MARDGLNRNTKRAVENMNAQSFGEVLRKNRERHGISLHEVAEDLHVREDILVAIEESDFSKIPPQGYSRNMIKSYARLLGMDPNKITGMFLDAEYSYQIKKKRESAQMIVDENKKRAPKPIIPKKKTMTPREQIEEAKRRRAAGASEEKTQDIEPGKRIYHTYGKKYKNTPRARRELDRGSDPSHNRIGYVSKAGTSADLLYGDNYDTAKNRLESRKRHHMTHRHKISRNDSYALSDKENPNTIPTSGRTQPYSYLNAQKQSSNSINNALQNKLMIPIIAGAVVVLVVILICVFFFVGKQAENDKTDVSKLNVVGISDVENPNTESNEEGEENKATEPKEVEFKYKVKDGYTVYMEIYEGSNNRPTLAREVKSGETNSFKVTSTLKFVTSKPEGVEIYVDNELVQPTDPKGLGVYNYTVDFNQWLSA